MRFRTIFFSVAFSLGFLVMNGQETVVLKNGNRFMGHLSSENYDNGQFVFMADSAIVVERLANVRFSPPKLRSIKDMKMKWSRWFETNPAYIVNVANQAKGWLGHIAYGDNCSDELGGDVVIKELSDSIVKYFIVTQTSPTFKRSTEVDHFEYATRHPMAMVGTVDEIVLTDGSTLSGEIVANYPGYLVLRTNDKVNRPISYSKISSKRVLPYNLARPLSEQVPYLSILSLKDADGVEREVSGIITETVYRPTTGEKPHYVVTDGDNQNPCKYPFEEVSRISFRSNSAFIQGLDVELAPGETMIAGSVAKPVTCQEVGERYAVVDSTNIVAVKARDLAGGNLNINVKNNPGVEEFLFIEATPVAPLKGQSNSKGRGKTPVEYYTVNTMSMAFNAIEPVERCVTPHNNVSLKYNIQAGRAYMFMRKSDKSTYLIVIE